MDEVTATETRSTLKHCMGL